MFASPEMPLTPLSLPSIAAVTPPRSSTPCHTASPGIVSSPASTSNSVSTPAKVNDTDSVKSSCSPALLDCSFDSGISVETPDPQLQKRIQQCKRILIALERDKERYRKLRERLSKIVDKKSKNVTADEHSCNICCTPLDVDDAKAFVQCCTCKKHICRGVKCANWLPKSAQWECQLCHSSKESMAQTSSWVAEQMSFNQQKFVYPLRARSEVYIPINDVTDSSMHFESASQIGANSAVITAEQKVKIREYVEELVASMLGGTLDNVRVNKLSKSENYLLLFEKYHSKLSNILIGMENELSSKALQGDLPAIVNGQNTHTQAASIQHNDNSSTEQQQDFSNISQTRLRQLIEAIIAETLTHAPALSTSGAVSEIALDTRCNGATPLTNGVGPAQRHRTEHYFEPTIYQDLLATAVLNKIVDNQSHNNRRFSESTPDLSGRNTDPNYHEENRSTSSGSSVEPRSDCSYTDTEHILNISKGENEISPCDSRQNLHADDRPLRLIAGRESALSDYIASHMVPLPDLSAPPTESEEEDYLSVNSSAFGEGTWEDNWLFKKKRGADLKSSVGANSVGMLVPAPKEDVRAQIGDKTADEVSDLSEMGSDTDDSSLDLLRNNELDPLNDRLLNKHLIGGQNTKMVLDELIERTSMISHTSLAENEPVFTETKNEGVLKAAAKAEAINSNFEQTQAETQSHAEQTIEETDGSTTANPLADPLDSESLADSVSTDIITEKSNDSEISSTSSLSETAVSTTNENFATNINTTNTTTATIITNVNIEIDADKNVNKAARAEADISPEIQCSDQLGSETIAVSESTDIVAEKCNESEMSNTCTLSETAVNTAAENVATIINTTNTYNQTFLTNVELKVDAEKNLDIEAHAEKDVSPEIVNVEDDVTLRRHFLPGSIAEREYMKWNNAVEMPNNPYAPEALKKRISRSRDCFMDLPSISPSKELNPATLIQDAKDADATNEQTNREIEVQRYSRDYYINEARQNGATIPKQQTSVEANSVTMNGSNHNSDEPAIDHITINEPAKAIVTALPQPETQTPPETANETSTHATEVLYQALPAQIVEEEHPPSSIETHSNQSLQSVHTSSSDESDTVRVYDFQKQETIKIRDAAARRGRAVSMEAMGTAATDSSSAVEPAARKERPSDLQFKRTTSADGLRARSPVKPNRGSTPTALRFLQPKRKLIEPSQVLAQHCTDEPQAQTPAEPLDKAVIEQDVVLSLPSVKALARAFLEQSNEEPKQLKCWRVKTKLTPEILKHFTPIVPSKNFETSPAPIAATANRSTSCTFKSEQIISNNNNNTNVSVEETKDNTTNTTPTTTTTASTTHAIIPTGKMSPIPMLPEGFLKGNIAFFENLKSK